MPVQLGSQPEHGFDRPLGLLSDCHRRIERFLEMLQKVAEQGWSGVLMRSGGGRWTQPEYSVGRAAAHRR